MDGMTGLGLSTANEVNTEEYAGVGGWLLLFCLDLTLLVPGIAAYRVFGHTLPMLARTHDPRREALWTVYVVMVLGVAAVAFATGIRLWLVRTGAVRMAKLWLLMMFCANVSRFFLWLVLFWHHRTDSVAKVAWDHVWAPLVGFLLWNAYLAHSKRVRATYR